MSPAEVGAGRKEETGEQEGRAGKGGDPGGPGRCRNKFIGLWVIPFGSTEFCDVTHLVACRKPGKDKWQFLQARLTGERCKGS